MFLKNKKWIINVVFLLFLSLLAFVFIFDDELNPKVQPILDEYNTQYTKEDNGSVYQLGMWSALDTSPYDVGLWRLNQYKEALTSQNDSIVDLEFEDYPEGDWIEQLYSEDEKPELLCDFQEYKCLNLIYKKIEDVSQLIARNAAYIERYDGLMQFDKFELYEKPSYLLPMMKFGPSLDILKLKLMTIFEQVKLKNYEFASAEISRLVLFNKSILEQTPYIMPKVVSLLELELTLDAAAFLISQTDLESRSDWSSFVEVLTQLTPNQLKFDKPLLVDFVSQINTLDVMGVENFSSTLPNYIKDLPLSVAFKRNRSINMSYNVMTVHMGKIELVGNRIVRYEKVDTKDLLTFDYTNAIGSLLIMSVTPRFLDLEGALYDSEVKQRMIKHQYHHGIQSLFISPYTEEKASFSDNMFCSDSYNDDKDICVTAF